MATDCVLQYRLGDGEWQEFVFQVGEVFIGRGGDCDLVIDHQEVSRQHLRLQWDGSRVSLVDLNSSNGTFIDSKKIEPTLSYPLSPGQLVSVGGYFLILKGDSFDATQMVASREPSFSQRFRLRYQKEGQPWAYYLLSHGETSVGRSEENDLFLDHEELSRKHAAFYVEGNKVFVADLGSTNGTFLDHAQLTPHQQYPFHPGQALTMGGYTFSVEPIGELGMSSAGGSMIMPGDAVSLDGAGTPKTMLDVDMPTEPTAVKTMNLASHDRVTLGRAGDNEVVLDHPLVSRYHAVLERVGKRYCIKDLKSTNGVYVNEKIIEKDAFLKDYARIRIGPFVFVIAGERLEGKIEKGIRILAKDINQQVTESLNLLKNINLIIDSNEFVSLVGMSGAGKTTFMNAINGYWPASHGQVLVNGIDLYDHYDMFRDEIGYVPQKDIVHTDLTPEMALDYVAQLRMPPDTTKKERLAVVAEVLEELDLTERKDIPIKRLSGGQLKRVSIGVELLTKPRLFFLDEPTSGLDPGTEYDMMKLMRRLGDQGRTIILITHATKNVMLCDKVIIITRGGNLAFYGAPEDALEYFDEYRTDRERREKDMEFDDIYRILNDDSRGMPNEWRERYLRSRVYAEIMGFDGPQPMEQETAAQKSGKIQTAKRKLFLLAAIPDPFSA